MTDIDPEKDPELEAMARAIWLADKPHGNWENRLTWTRVSPEEQARMIRERGTHPDNFTHNEDVENAYKFATAARNASRKWMRENGYEVVRYTEADRSFDKFVEAQRTCQNEEVSNNLALAIKDTP